MTIEQPIYIQCALCGNLLNVKEAVHIYTSAEYNKYDNTWAAYICNDCNRAIIEIINQGQEDLAKVVREKGKESGKFRRLALSFLPEVVLKDDDDAVEHNNATIIYDEESKTFTVKEE